MDRKSQLNGLINLVTLLVAGVASYAASRCSDSFAGLVATAFMTIGVLVAGVSWFQTRLEERERNEKLEFDELTKSASSSALFNATESEVFAAKRSREQFERFFVPGFSVLLFLLQAGGGFLIWRWLLKASPAPIQQQTVAMSLFAFLGLLLFLLGKFSTTIARLDGVRLLRPGASYLLLSAYLCGLVLAGIVFSWAEFIKVDLYLARCLAGVLILIGLETLISLVLEIYRPRVKGKIERPLYESRVVSLLGQPEGLITTAAQTLDYQFGFSVSETWGYRLFADWLPWLILGQLAVLVLSTSFVFIDAGQQALLEYCGRPVAVLGPGAHLKCPWPIERVYRYSTERIQSFDVGYTLDEATAASPVVLWTVPHAKEENFLVANRQIATQADTNNASGKRPPPVSLLTVSIPIQFQITNLTEWAYNNNDPAGLLQEIATREVIHYLVSVDLQEIMSRGRSDATLKLRERIQAEADARALGARIIFVGLQDIHPPVKVAPDYEKVVAAIHTRAATILDAKADAIRTNTMADALAYKTVTAARAESLRLEMDAVARAALFTNQIPAYLASPSVYAQRTYLESFIRATANSRKYLRLATNTHDVLILDLEDKVRSDILDTISVQPPKTPIPGK